MARSTSWGTAESSDRRADRSAAAATPTVIAHRGASSEAPENTLAAFDAAVDAARTAACATTGSATDAVSTAAASAAAGNSAASAAAWIELDLQHSADGEVVVIHDDVLDRTTDGRGAVSDHTLGELRALDAGGWFTETGTGADHGISTGTGSGTDSSRHRGDASEFVGQRIPTLAELAQWIAANPTAHVLVEYKGAWSPQQITPTVTAFEAAGVGERLVLQSFDPATVRALQLRAGDYARGLLIDEQAHYPEIEIAELLGVSAVNPHWRRALAEPALLREVHERLGASVAVWTPDEPADWDALVRIGVDAIITNRPRQAHRHLASR